MAVDLHDRETVVPSKLQTHEDSPGQTRNIMCISERSSETGSVGFGSSGSSVSGLSTPSGSDLGSTELDTEENDFLNELTRQMADFMLREDDIANGSPEKKSDCNTGGSLKPESPGTGFYFRQAYGDEQMNYPMELYQVEKQHNMIYEKVHQKEHKNKGMAPGSGQGPIRNGSGMRAIFLGGSEMGTGYSGTGVFLPRGSNHRTDANRKSGCSTVLIPDRVIETLNHHFNNMGGQSRSNGCGAFSPCSSKQETNIMSGKNPSTKRRRSKSKSKSQLHKEKDHEELQLPQEWTY